MNHTKEHDGLLRGLPTKTFSPEEEKSLIEIKAYNEIAMHNMREAFYYALFCAKTLPPDEVYSLCWKALSAAVRNFKPGRSARFFAFAKPYIRGEIYRTFKRFKVVTHGETEQLYPDSVIDPCDDQSYTFVNNCDVSESQKSFQKMDKVEPDFDAIMARDEWNRLKSVLSELKEKERMVLQLFYQSGLNFRQIGDLLNVSRSDIQATHANALRKIRCALARKPALFSR